MIAVLVSSFREGSPFLSTVRSALIAGDWILVDDSPIGDAPETGDETPYESVRHMGSVYTEHPKRIGSDAEKRSRMLRRAKTIANERKKPDEEPLWVVWLDGDELLLFGEYLRDHVYRAEFVTGAGGFPIRIVELDGSVALSYGKIIRAEHVTRYLQSSYQVELVSGAIVALPNVKVCSAGGIPYLTPEVNAELHARQDEILAVHRPPLAGEPHILHRSILRSPERDAERQSKAEGRWFREILGPDGQVLKELPVE